MIQEYSWQLNYMVTQKKVHTRSLLFGLTKAFDLDREQSQIDFFFFGKDLFNLMR